MAVKSSRSVFQVLNLLASEKKPLDVSYVANLLSIPMTSTLRVLGTLEAAGFAERDRASGRFKLGKAASTLSFAFMSQFPVRDLALPYMQRLTLETGQTATLFVRLGWNSLRVAAVLGQRRWIHSMPVGEMRPLSLGAHGLAILSSLNEEERASALSRLGLSELPVSTVRRETSGGSLFICESIGESSAFDCAWALHDNMGKVVASVGFEGVLEHAVTDVSSPGSPAVEIITELSKTVSRGLSVEMSHYEHVPADTIMLKGNPVRK